MPSPTPEPELNVEAEHLEHGRDFAAEPLTLLELKDAESLVIDAIIDEYGSPMRKFPPGFERELDKAKIDRIAGKLMALLQQVSDQRVRERDQQILTCLRSDRDIDHLEDYLSHKEAGDGKIL